MKYVLIGNSTAAIGAVEGIRQADKEGQIVIITSEKYHTYSRPLISYLLCGKTDEEKMKYRGNNFYIDNNCQVLFGKTAKAIDALNQMVTLDSGELIYYDKLLVATGSSPFVPKMEGLDKVKQQYTFLTLDDAHALMAAVKPKSKVLIIGAGLIGLKCAEGLYETTRDITVVDLAPRILSSILDKEGAEIIQNHLEEKGIRFYLTDSVSQFDKNSAALKSGNVVNFDILVVAVGVKPNIDLIKNAGGQVERGIVVNDKMQTSLPNVYAAGDCTESLDLSSKKHKILALLPNAYLQGECAGRNMAGIESVFDKAIPMNAMTLLGLQMITAGSYIGVEIKHSHDGYKKFFLEDNLLKGYILIGNIKKAGIYTSLIREQIPLSSVDFDLLCDHPSLMAFQRPVRDKILGGVKT